MTPYLVSSIRWIPGTIHRLRSDSLIRNSLYLMTSTAVTAGLGYVFWILAAHAYTQQEIGISSAVIALCTAVALLTYLGPAAMLIERLPEREYTSKWSTFLLRMCVGTACVTFVVIAVTVPVLLASKNYRLFFSGFLPVLLVLLGAPICTIVNLLSAACIAARRAGRFLSIQVVVSGTKLLFVLPLAAALTGAAGLVVAWVASGVIGIVIGVIWLIPQMRLGRRPGRHQRRELHALVPGRRLPPRRGRRVGRPRRGGYHWSSNSAFMRRLFFHHLTSVGGAVTPLVLPVLVVLRLGPTENAYFYITWMIGGIFFTVSPSVASALFAEGVRAHADLGSVAAKALRVIAVVLTPVMIVVIAGGRPILDLFGPSYAAAGYGLLVLLAISALPDAVSNVAVAVLRVTKRVGYSSALNLGILVVALASAWVLMPLLGIVGVGVAWLGAQTLGAVASLPAFTHLRGLAPL
jgi:O-antigen/teichoic acid export membrane protein